MIDGRIAERLSRFMLGSLILVVVASSTPWRGVSALQAGGPGLAFSLFGSTTLVAFTSFVRLRRSDLAIALLVLVGAVNLVPMGGSGRDALGLVAASASGVLAVYALTHVESVRARMRERPDASVLRDRQEERRATWSVRLFARPSGRAPTPAAIVGPRP